MEYPICNQLIDKGGRIKPLLKSQCNNCNRIFAYRTPLFTNDGYLIIRPS